MQKICDLYIPLLQDSSELRFLKLYDKNFVYDKNAIYEEGFLNVNLPRVKLVNFVVQLRKQGVTAFNVPIEYRDNATLSEEQAYSYAKNYALSKNFDVSALSHISTPLYWVFPIINDPELRVGGNVTVDKLNGHIWSMDELEEYQYDYNNIL